MQFIDRVRPFNLKQKAISMKKHTISTWLQAGAVAAVLATGQGVCAADFPSKAVHIIVPFNPGGGVDRVARILAEKLRSNLGQDVIVENKPGGSAMIGAMAVVRSAPDGYTVLLGSAGETAINEYVYKDKMQYSPSKDLTPITVVTRIPNVVAVSPKLNVNSMADLMSYAKANPGKVKYATSGIGNVQHLNGALLGQMAGAQLVQVPYKGASKQLIDVASGDVDMTFVSYAASKSFISDNKVKALAVTSAKRAGFDASIPAVSETKGLEAYQLENWFGMFAPAKTPEPVLQALNKAVTDALKDPEIIEKLQNIGGNPSPMSLSEVRSFMETERKQLAQIVAAAGISVQ